MTKEPLTISIDPESELGHALEDSDGSPEMETGSMTGDLTVGSDHAREFLRGEYTALRNELVKRE